MTNLISRSRRGREGGREWGQERERGVSILYFQRCIKHIATVTRQQQVPAQQVPRERRALQALPSLCPGALPPSHRAPEWVAGRDSLGWGVGQGAGLGDGTVSGIRPTRLAQGWCGSYQCPDPESLLEAPGPRAFWAVEMA